MKKLRQMVLSLCPVIASGETQVWGHNGGSWLGVGPSAKPQESHKPGHRKVQTAQRVACNLSPCLCQRMPEPQGQALAGGSHLPRASWSPSQGHTHERRGGRLHAASASEPGPQAWSPGPRQDRPPGKGEGWVQAPSTALGASASGEGAAAVMTACDKPRRAWPLQASTGRRGSC